MGKVVRAFVTAALLALAVAAWSDSYSEGRDLYKQGKYAEAAAKLEQATREKPNDAKAWWQLNFAYHKLRRDSASLTAVQTAGKLDPSHGFTPDKSKFAQILSDRQKSAGGVLTAPAAQPGAVSGSTASGSGGGTIVQQLLQGDVYVQPGMSVDIARLQSVSQQLRPTVVKFMVFNSRSNSRMLDREASRVRTYLGSRIGNGYVIAASRSAVAASSRSLNPDTLQRLTRDVAPQMEAGDYTGGLERLARGLVQTRQQQTATTTNTWIIVLGAIAAIIVIWLVIKAAARSSAMARLRGPLERQRGDVISQLSFLDDNVKIMDGPAASAVREARISAGTKLDEASRVIAHAKSDRELSRAQGLLDQAQADIARGRAAISGGAGVLAGGAPRGFSTAGGHAAAPVSTDQGTNWGQVAQNEKGVCFFCSRPSLLSELTPVTVNIDGKQQKVLACPNDLATVRSGQTPNIRAFNDNGRYVPWYAYNNYDPYRDYYTRGYGGGSFMSDMIALSVIDSMFWNWHQPMGWGWGGYGGWGGGNTYVFYPDHDNYRDYYGGQAAGYSDFDRTPDSGGADFLQGSGGDLGGGYANTGAAQGGGTDFIGGSDHS